MPARLAIGWHYERWTHQGALRIFFANKAGREIVFVAAPFKGQLPRRHGEELPARRRQGLVGHTANEQQAWRCVNGMKLVAATSLPPNRFADVGLGRIAASGHRIR